MMWNNFGIGLAVGIILTLVCLTVIKETTRAACKDYYQTFSCKQIWIPLETVGNMEEHG